MTDDRFAALRAEIDDAEIMSKEEDIWWPVEIITIRALLDAEDELTRMRTHTTLVQNEALADEIHRAERAEAQRDRLAAALDDLSMMIRRLAHALPADSGLRTAALDLLERKGANSSPLRAAGMEKP